MAHENTVIRSVTEGGGRVCVDLFRRPNGSFGFETFQRDPEDGRGWYPVGFTADRVFADADTAWAEACSEVHWLFHSG